jgi:predicted O-methyltransferase YrrM
MSVTRNPKPAEHPFYAAPMSGMARPLAAMLADTTPVAGVEQVLPTDATPYPVSSAVTRFLARLVLEDGRRNVLEFGAGASSVALATALAKVRGQLTSVEKTPKWCEQEWELVHSMLADAVLVTSPLRFRVRPFGTYFEFRAARESLSVRAPFDLVFVDAPQSFFGRDGSLHVCADLLAPGALVILDDAGRRGERRTLSRWLRTYPALQLLHHDVGYFGKGLAVLRCRASLRHQSSVRAAISSGLSAAKAWTVRKRLRTELNPWVD